MNSGIAEYIKLKVRAVRKLRGDSITDFGVAIGIPKEEVASHNVPSMLNKGITSKSKYYDAVLAYIKENRKRIAKKIAKCVKTKKSHFKQETKEERMRMADEIRKARTELNLSVEEFATSMMVDEKYVINWETNGMSVKSIYFERVCEMLGIEPEDVFRKNDKGDGSGACEVDESESSESEEV